MLWRYIMPSLIFVTSNKGKVASMRKWVEPDIKVYRYRKAINFSEDKDHTVEQTAQDKIRQVKNEIKQPFVVQDSGFFLEAKEGYPGPHVNHVLNTMGIDGLLKLVPEDNRGCFFKDVLAFWSPTYQKRFGKDAAAIFVGKVHGHVAMKPSTSTRKEMWSALWTIFIPDGFNSTLAEMDEKEQERFAATIRSKLESNCFLQFAQWIKDHLEFMSVQGEFDFLNPEEVDLKPKRSHKTKTYPELKDIQNKIDFDN